MQLSIPKKIWIYWAQGESQAPFLVQQCLLSWRQLNPDWEISVLDRASLADFVDLEGFDARPDIGLQALTDILRLKLLTRLGGVWVDATLFCSRPLDQWLPAHISDYFFAFASKRSDRLLTTWFLAGTQDSQLLSAWTQTVLDYWRGHRFRQPDLYWTRQVLRKLTSLRKRHLISNDAWFSTLVAQWLRIYPYPVNMYLFERALERKPDLKRV